MLDGTDGEKGGAGMRQNRQACGKHSTKHKFRAAARGSLLASPCVVVPKQGSPTHRGPSHGPKAEIVDFTHTSWH